MILVGDGCTEERHDPITGVLVYGPFEAVYPLRQDLEEAIHHVVPLLGINLIRKTEAVGTGLERVTEYTYDEDGNLLTTKRLANANTAEALTVMTYDALENLISITDPEGGLTRFTSHDAMGNVLTKIDARGKQPNFQRVGRK